DRRQNGSRAARKTVLGVVGVLPVQGGSSTAVYPRPVIFHDIVAVREGDDIEVGGGTIQDETVGRGNGAPDPGRPVRPGHSSPPTAACEGTEHDVVAVGQRSDPANEP